MSRILALSTLAFSLAAIAPGTASANRKCSSFNADKLIATADQVCAKIDGTKRYDCDRDKTGQVAADLKDWLGIWNGLANNGPATIGPRIISWTAGEHGRVIAPGDRTWVSDMPADGGVTVKIKYQEGNAKVHVSYCSIDADGNVRLLDSQTVQKGSPRLRTFTPEQMDGKFLAVQVDGLRPWTRAYEYDIRIKADGKKLAPR